MGLVEMAHDSESELFVFYGGLTGRSVRAGSVVGGTRVFDAAQRTWIEIETDAPAPFPQGYLVLVAEPALGGLLGPTRMTWRLPTITTTATHGRRVRVHI